MSGENPEPTAPVLEGLIPIPASIESGGLEEPLLSSEEDNVIVEAPVAQEVVRDSVIVANEVHIHVAESASEGRDNWKDSICNCCAHGCCHPAIICGLCFPMIAIAQVMRRLQLNLCGSKTTIGQSRCTFYLILTLYIACIVGIGVFHRDRVIQAISTAYVSFLLYLIFITRRHIRKKDMIRNRCLCEDCCVTWFLPQLAICQMARHTAEYDLYVSNFCSETGLPERAPSLV